MQARRSHPAESSSLSYGLVVHLLLLSTPPRGDAVAVGYRPESVCLKRTFTSPTTRAFRRTQPRPLGRDSIPVKNKSGPKGRHDAMFMPVLRTFSIISNTATTTLRSWLLNDGPSGLMTRNHRK